MAEKMKQLVLMDKGLQGKGGKWTMREVDIPHPGPNQLLVRVDASTICNQTDLNTIKALHPPHDHPVSYTHLDVYKRQAESSG